MQQSYEIATVILILEMRKLRFRRVVTFSQVTQIGNDGTLDNAKDVVDCVSIQPISKLVTFVLCGGRGGSVEWAFLNWRLSWERVQRVGWDMTIG